MKSTNVIDRIKKNLSKIDWKKVVIGAKRPIILLLGMGITYLAAKPDWAWLVAGGLTAERIYSTIEFLVTNE
jgi:hypothetical protein